MTPNDGRSGTMAATKRAILSNIFARYTGDTYVVAGVHSSGPKIFDCTTAQGRFPEYTEDGTAGAKSGICNFK